MFVKLKSDSNYIASRIHPKIGSEYECVGEILSSKKYINDTKRALVRWFKDWNGKGTSYTSYCKNVYNLNDLLTYNFLNNKCDMPLTNEYKSIW